MKICMPATQLLGCLGSLIKLPHHLLQSGIDPTCTTAIARSSSAQLPVQQAGADQLDHRHTAADHDHGGNGDDDDPSALDALFCSIDSPANYLSDSNRSNFISFDASLDRGPLQVISILIYLTKSQLHWKDDSINLPSDLICQLHFSLQISPIIIMYDSKLIFKILPKFCKII